MSTQIADGRARVTRHRWVARVAIAGIAMLLGVGQAIAWSRIAPGQQVMVFADGSYISLPTADYHPFTGLALDAFAGVAVGLIVAVAAWRIRAIRGATTLTFIAAGTAVGSAIAYWVGLAMAGGVDPATVGSTGKASIVVAGASMGTPFVMIIEPLIAIAVYTFLAAWDGRRDLGSTRAVPQAVLAEQDVLPPSGPAG
ncbi:MAG: hypothetical protein ABI382_08040 [Nakamurella sp.]